MTEPSTCRRTRRPRFAWVWLLLPIPIAFAAASAANAEEILGVREDGALVTFDSASPGTLRNVRPVTGLVDGELLVGVDFRPSDGSLYAVGNTSRLYRIQAETGVAVSISSIPFTPNLEGTDFGVTFELSGDAIRVTSDTGQNLVLNAATGATTAIDSRLVYAAGDVSAGQTAGIVACAWAFSDLDGNVLYGIDLARGRLVKIDTPSTGSCLTVGSLGVSGLVTGGYTSLDASPDTGRVFAVLDAMNDTVSRAYSVSLTTGVASTLGTAVPELLRAAAVVPASPPAPPGTRLAGLVAPADVVSFTTDVPGRILRAVHLRGLPPGDSFLAISTRPSTGVLYGLTRTGLWDLDLSGGTAELVGTGLGRTLAAATPVGCDFDPATGRLRVVSGSDVNFTVDPATGLATADDSPLAFDAGDPHAGDVPSVRAIAYTGRALPGNPSKCYALETNDVLLARLGRPASAPDEARDGTLFSVGPLSIDGVTLLPPNQTLTITGDRTGYASLATGPVTSSLFHVDLTGGKAKFVGGIAATGLVRALTAEPTADPPRFSISKGSLALNLKKAGRDGVTLKGSVPFAVGDPNGKSVTIDVGGRSKTFVMDSRGKGALDGDTLRISGVAPRGIAFKLVWKREDLVSVLGDEQMNGLVFAQRAPRQLVVLLTVDGKTYRATMDVSYSAKPGKSGSAKMN